MNQTSPLSDVERQRRYRQRKRDGIRIISVELGKAEIDALIDRGGLSAGKVDDPTEIGRAIHELIVED